VIVIRGYSTLSRQVLQVREKNTYSFLTKLHNSSFNLI